MDDIRPLDEELSDRAVATLVRAFSPDPMFRWIFPDASQRPGSLRSLFLPLMKFSRRYGRVMHSHEGRAVAIWMPPGKAVDAIGMIRSGMLAVPFRIGLSPFGKFMGANDRMGRIHKEKVPEPHWYLFAVGVDPELQGRGVGSTLVKTVLDDADRTSVSCYLETSEERNLAFYNRLGFEVLETVPLGKGGPPGWAMRRRSQAVANPNA